MLLIIIQYSIIKHVDGSLKSLWHHQTSFKKLHFIHVEFMDICRKEFHWSSLQKTGSVQSTYRNQSINQSINQHCDIIVWLSLQMILILKSEYSSIGTQHGLPRPPYCSQTGSGFGSKALFTPGVNMRPGWSDHSDHIHRWRTAYSTDSFTRQQLLVKVRKIEEAGGEASCGVGMIVKN